MIEQSVAEAADRLWDAARSGVATTAVRDLLGTEDLTTAKATDQELSA